VRAATAPATVRRVAAWTKACGVCRRTYGPSDWRGLPVVATLPTTSVQPYLSVPVPWAVELRTCACGAALAARRP
jgi:hypothetical protein